MPWLYQADEVSWFFFICDYSELAIHKGQLHKYLSVARAQGSHLLRAPDQRVSTFFIMKSWEKWRRERLPPPTPCLCLHMNYWLPLLLLLWSSGIAFLNLERKRGVAHVLLEMTACWIMNLWVQELAPLLNRKGSCGNWIGWKPGVG